MMPKPYPNHPFKRGDLSVRPLDRSDAQECLKGREKEESWRKMKPLGR
ncbi:hypothetical protein COLO4_20250 [Corchorus olitorius]|uniref:Uncharacterized protein n=1 Tax=Corchorus olitorius TaxID=93759 RepID=A0A1R3J0V2_9ROSI|nr:hypothetical protein COLO4_20250 [Corchorus olitorius]